jgi:hypothetical protein
MPSTENYQTVITAIAEGSFDRLLGTIETLDVEYKSEQYRFAQKEEKVEFVKDVCSMLNAGGGVIVIGIRTTRFQTVASEVATGYIPMKYSKVGAPDMLQVLLDYTFPQISPEDIDIDFVQDPRITAGQMGLIVIAVSGSPLTIGPTMIKTDEQWGVPSLIYPRRNADCKTFYPLEDLSVSLSS